MKTKNLFIAGLLLGSAFMAQQTSAQFSPFDNFNSYTAGQALDGQGGWTLGSGTTGITVQSAPGGFGSGNIAQYNENYPNVSGTEAPIETDLALRAAARLPPFSCSSPCPAYP